jgi:hypothetical protein
MKRTLVIAIAVLALSACNQKEKEKTLLDDIMKTHDKVMGHDELLMKNKMKLDTLLQPGRITGSDTLQQRATIRAMGYMLSVADNSMEQWMKNFQPDIKGRSHDETMDYLTDQKKKIIAVDSQLNVAVDQSSDYLKHYIKVQK